MTIALEPSQATIPSVETVLMPTAVERQVGHAAVRAEVEVDHTTRALMIATKSSADAYARAVWNSRRER